MGILRLPHQKLCYWIFVDVHNFDSPCIFNFLHLTIQFPSRGHSYFFFSRSCILSKFQRADALIIPPVDVGAPWSMIELGSECVTEPAPGNPHFSLLLWIHHCLLICLVFPFSFFFIRHSGFSISKFPCFSHATHLVCALIRSVRLSS